MKPRTLCNYYENKNNFFKKGIEEYLFTTKCCQYLALPPGEQIVFLSNFSTNYFLFLADPRTENTATSGALTSTQTSWEH
jgi:hypothetical protein